MEIAQYQAAHHPVTLADVAQARTQRDATWQSIKDGALELAAAASRFETAVVKADSLSDLRHDKAQEATQLQSNFDRLQRLELQMEQLQQRLQESTARLNDFDQAWNGRMSTLGLPGMELLQINDWRAAREKVLSVADALAQELTAQQDLDRTTAAATAGLLQALQVADPMTPAMHLTAMMSAADETVGNAARIQERRTALLSPRTRAQALEPGLRNRAEQAKAAVDAWGQDLQTALAQVSLPPKASIATADAALVLFERMHQQLQKIRDTRLTRVDMMRRDLEAFDKSARALATELAPDIANASAAEISVRLDAQLKLDAAAAQDLGRLQDELNKAETLARSARSRIAEASAGLAPLLQLSGAPCNEELRSATVKSDRLHALTSEKDRALKQLLVEGDGMDRDALAAELAATDTHSILASLADNKRQTDELIEQQNRLSGDLSTAQTVLGKIAGQADAARAESQRQEALAKMANVLERFIKVYTAAKLLRWAIEKLREEKQGPMLSRASAVFCGLTQGAFGKLVV